MFYGSYLGGVMTLAGVLFTIEHERKIHQYEKVLQDIENEKQQIGQAIREINTVLPSMLYQQFNSLPITPLGYNGNDVAAIRCRIFEELQKTNSFGISLMFFTDAYSQMGACTACKAPCKIKEILPEFQKTYQLVESKIYEALTKIDEYIRNADSNARYTALIQTHGGTNVSCVSNQKKAMYSEEFLREYHSHIIELKPYHDEIQKILVEINSYNQKEIQKLMTLGREYIAIRQSKVHNQCFGKRKETE